jgi:hypothetical protein
VLASLVSENISHVLQATSVVQVGQTVSEPLHPICCTEGTTWVAGAAVASFLMLSPLFMVHLCLQEVLWEVNLCLHPLHCLSHWGSLTALAASCSCSCLAAWCHLHARCFFSFWALLALWPPFWKFFLFFTHHHYSVLQITDLMPSF